MTAEHIDVLIVGAGLSGVATAYHLQRKCPEKSFLILEGRQAMGGTWDLFRYPGIRSDSDMATLGFGFRPWDEDASIVGGERIRDYVQTTAAECGIDAHIRFGHAVTGAEWSSEEARWRVFARTAEGESVEITCSMLVSCAGYYDYAQGHTPEFPGREDFGGEVIHPQHWPEGLDHRGKRIVVIGSGATAVTVVPAMAEEAEHVTMLQRSPTYMVSRPATPEFSVRARRLLPRRIASRVIRTRNILLGALNYQIARRLPVRTKERILAGVQCQLPRGFDIATHFTPAYDPWDQRLCLVPDGDMFRAVSEGRASVVTGGIDRFTESGIRLQSGEMLEADVIVTATGLNMRAIGGMELTVDGSRVDIAETVAYKGMMLSGVPNFAFVIGYVNSSWTLRAELVAKYLCGVIRHMDTTGTAVCTPAEPGDARRAPLFGLTSGYAQRGNAVMPKQGGRAPWRMHHNYLREMLTTLNRSRIDDDGVSFERARPAGASPAGVRPDRPATAEIRLASAAGARDAA
ncbi:flavin-containing monooxygenase [Brevibacterium album]|uniref:flavin-containing monooxygenase n=1 Tax=Brevibacterium album TaxID=417948 RepID=UPI00042094E5|nr:NAD(P)/FAD-dependent oxidoreductase [Brevibacterium album]